MFSVRCYDAYDLCRYHHDQTDFILRTQVIDPGEMLECLSLADDQC